MNNKAIPIKVSQLYKMASDYIKHPTDENEIEQINITEIVYADIEQSLQNGKRLMIEITGDTRDGKSTIGAKFGEDIFNMMKKIYKNKLGIHKEFGLHNILADQQEVQEIMTNENIHHTILIADEENESEKGGINSTAEQDQRTDQSNIQAGRYISIIKCHPYGLTDPNTKLLLHVIDRDEIKINGKVRNITRCKVYFVFKEGAMIEPHTQILGYMDFDVTDTIKNWLKIEPLTFLEKPKNKIKSLGDKVHKIGTKEHTQYTQYCEHYKSCQDIIKKYKEKDWYVKYQLRKYYLIDLPQKRGIQRKRMLKYSPMMLYIINNFKELVINTQKIEHNMIKNEVKNSFREFKLPYSILGEEMMTKDIIGVLTCYKEIQALNNKCNKEELKTHPNPKLINQYDKGISLYNKILKKQLDEINLMIKVYNEMREMVKTL